MNKDKQVEEMQNDLIEISKNPIMIDGLEHWSDVIAEKLIGKGYRKASEVAREIFEEIDRMIYRLLNDRHYIVGDMCYEVEELKKKYTEGEG